MDKKVSEGVHGNIAKGIDKARTEEDKKRVFKEAQMHHKKAHGEPHADARPTTHDEL